MEDINIAYKLQRFMKDQLSNLTSIVTSGGVDSMEDYKYILGQIRTYEYILQEISNLLNNKELVQNEQGNVIKLD
ncbi:MAG: hypothetical protein EBR82_60310 [Caulobacteraceae bacterium]|jgi:hypothetical protein|nr:hypothetical protein [Caulobacteraceae bacterium]